MRSSKTITIVLISLLFILLLTACQATIILAVPQNLSLRGSLLEWSAVPNAYSYEVSLDGELFLVKTPYFNIPAEEPGEYMLKVRAVGEGQFQSSDFSEEITFVKAEGGAVVDSLTRLATPSITVINGQGVMQWRTITGAIGYRIYINNSVAHIISGGAVTSFTLSITEEGSYSVQLQAIADSTKNLDSNKSSSYGYIINSDGKPRLPMLSKPSVSYDAARKALYWSRNPLATGYAVSANGTDISDAEYSIEGNTVYFGLSHSQGVNVYSVKSLGDYSAYSDSVYSNEISFPLEVTAPPGALRIGLLSEGGSDRLAVFWDDVVYSVGYIAEICGVQYNTTNTYFEIPLLDDGKYMVKVRSAGDSVYYTSSPYSAEIEVEIRGGRIVHALDIPSEVLWLHRRVDWPRVTGATGYTVALTNVTLQTARVESVIADNYYIFAPEDNNIYIFSVKANGNLLFADSNWSAEILVRLSAANNYLDTPADLTYTGSRIEWLSVPNAASYLLLLNGVEIFVGSPYYNCVLESGAHIVKVKAVSSNSSYKDSVFTEEFLITVPLLLGTPVIELFGNILYYDAVEYAESYRIFANGELLADTVYNLYFDLRNAITIDGYYYLAVQAIGSGIFADSPRSREIVYIKTDAPTGTAEKPIEINTAADFLAIKNAPDAYYTIKASLLDFATAGEKLELEPLFNAGMPFRGVIIGNGCVIKNIALKESNGVTGLFGALNGARIESLIITDVVLEGTLSVKNAGIICSQMTNSVIRFLNIIATIDITAAANVGIVAGSAAGEISDCDFYADITVNGNGIAAGVAAGIMYGTMNRIRIRTEGGRGALIVNGNEAKLGAACGIMYGSVNSVSANITVAAAGSSVNAGGLFGHAESNIINSWFSGALSVSGGGTAYVGGLAANLVGTASAVTVSGSVAYSGAICFAGGIFGRISGSASSVAVSGLSMLLIGDRVTAGGVFASGNIIALSGAAVNVTAIAQGSEVYLGGVSGISSTAFEGGTINAVLTASGGSVTVGGVSGKNTGNAIDMTVNADITVDGSGFAGGAFGELYGNTVLVMQGRLEAAGEALTLGGVAAYCEGSITADIGSSANRYKISAAGDNITAGGVAGVLFGLVQTQAFVEIENGKALTGGVAAIAEVEGNISVDALITASDGVAGGAFAILEGAVTGSVTSHLTVSGNVTAGGAVGENYALLTLNVQSTLIVTQGESVFAGGIAGRDEYGISGTVMATLLLEIAGGYAGLAVGYGLGEYELEAYGDMSVSQSSGESYLYVGGICGYAHSVKGLFDGIIAADGANLYIGGIAGEAILIDTAAVSVSITASASARLYAGSIAGYAVNANNCNAEGSVMTLNAPLLYAGVFGIVERVDNTDASNITINASAADTLYIGLLAGRAVSIYNCAVGGAVDRARIAVHGDALTAFIGGAAGEIGTGGVLQGVSVYVNIDVDIQGYAFVGGISGKGGIYEKSFAQANIELVASEAQVGGIAAQIVSASNCYFAGTINAYAETLISGGFVASGEADAYNCYAVADITLDGANVKGGLFAADITGYISSAYTTGAIISESVIESTDYSAALLSNAYTDSLAICGAKVATIAALGYGRTVYVGFENNWVLAADCYPILKDMGGQLVQAELAFVESFLLQFDGAVNEYLPYKADVSGIFNMVTWVSDDISKIRIINGTLYRYSSGAVNLKGYLSGGIQALSVNVTVTGESIDGDGTEINPYVINSIKWLHYLEAYKSACFEITEDIELYYYDIFPIGGYAEPFSGKLEGNGKTISGLKIKGEFEYAGFFGYLSGAEISNIRFENTVLDIVDCGYAGILAGYAAESVIVNVTAQGELRVSNALSAGGLIGSAADSTINAAGFYGTMLLNYCDIAGGFIGSIAGSVISRAYANVMLSSAGGLNYGGLIGAVDSGSTVSASYAASNATLSGSVLMGGFVFHSDGEIAESYAVTETNGFEIGAFAYFSYGIFDNCYAIAPTFGVHLPVVSGADTGVSLMSLSSVAGVLFESQAGWAVEPTALPRLEGIAGQGAIVQPFAAVLSIVIADSDIVDISRYIEISTGVFGAAEVMSSNTDILYFDAQGYAVLLANAAASELNLYFTFEGGFIISVEVIIALTPNPDFAGGYGSELSPYKIATAEEFGKIFNYGYAYFELQNNILLDQSYVKNNFAAYLNGNGYTITLSGNSGMFTYATGRIYNLKINANIVVSDTQYASVIAEMGEYLTIEDIDIAYIINAQNVSYAGGLVAYANRVSISDIRMNNCVLVAEGTAVTAGGIAGYAAGSSLAVDFAIRDITGSIGVYVESVSGYAGGVVGNSEISIAYIDIVAAVELNGIANLFAGGAAGRITDACYMVFVEDGIITVNASKASVFVGGIAGYAERIVECFVKSCEIGVVLTLNNMNISASQYAATLVHLGGIAGRAGSADTVAVTDSEVSLSFLAANVTSNHTAMYLYAGGVVGSGNRLSNAYFDASLSVSASGSYNEALNYFTVYAGGITGRVYSSTLLSAKGSLSMSISNLAKGYAGGLTGAISGEYSEYSALAFAVARISMNLSSGVISGGIAGYFDAVYVEEECEDCEGDDHDHDHELVLLLTNCYYDSTLYEGEIFGEGELQEDTYLDVGAKTSAEITVSSLYPESILIAEIDGVDYYADCWNREIWIVEDTNTPYIDGRLL